MRGRREIRGKSIWETKVEWRGERERKKRDKGKGKDCPNLDHSEAGLLRGSGDALVAGDTEAPLIQPLHHAHLPHPPQPSKVEISICLQNLETLRH